MYTLFRTARPKTIPCPAARPHIAQIREYPPPPGDETAISNEVKSQSLFSLAKPFEAGRLKQVAYEWEKLTSDLHILDCVKHCHIEFIQGETPKQKFYPRELRFTPTEKAIIDTELKKLIDKKV